MCRSFHEEGITVPFAGCPYCPVTSKISDSNNKDLKTIDRFPNFLVIVKWPFIFGSDHFHICNLDWVTCVKRQFLPVI